MNNSIGSQEIAKQVERELEPQLQKTLYSKESKQLEPGMQKSTGILQQVRELEPQLMKSPELQKSIRE